VSASRAPIASGASLLLSEKMKAPKDGAANDASSDTDISVVSHYLVPK
jgi:hypothetical protein